MKFSSVLLSATFVLCALPAAAASTGSSTPPSCPGDQPVWVNTKSKAYHTASDPLYGKTTHGAYMCKAAADAAGDHLSGSKSGSKTTGATTTNSSSSTGTSGNTSVMGGTAGGGSATTGTTGASPAPSKHHHHHSSGSTASPAPAAT